MPERGEVWLVDFGITQKVRPALVISVPYADADAVKSISLEYLLAISRAHL